MAKDTKKAITKKKAIASKSTMNLAFHESSFKLQRVIPTALVLVIAIGLFVYYGFLVPTDKKTLAYSELAEKQTELSSITAQLQGYDELADQYGRYSYGWLTDTEASLVDRMEVISILENTVAPAATIDDFAINNNVLAVNISGLSLNETSTLVQALESDELITSVSVYTAKSTEGGQDEEDSGQQASVSMTIILDKGGEDDE
jgi:hypothetical protein